MNNYISGPFCFPENAPAFIVKLPNGEHNVAYANPNVQILIWLWNSSLKEPAMMRTLDKSAYITPGLVNDPHNCG